MPDKIFRFLLPISAIMLLCGSPFAAASLPASAPDTISTIIISGNRVTGNETVGFLSGLTIGMRFDSTQMEKARKRLKESGLFYKVDILSLRGGGGYRIYIILTEKFYLLPYDLGGELYSFRYGKPHQSWRLRVGMEYTNFRGKAEILRTSFSIWDWHSIGIGWYKPFLPSPYYLSLGVSADQLPDEVFPIDHSILRSTMTAGRKLPLNSRIDVSLMPMFRRRVELGQDLSVADTEKVYEAFSLVRWRTDFRDAAFDPTDGWMLAMDLRTNVLYNGIAPRFFQVNHDVRWYKRGLSPTHRLACRLTSTLRNSDAGKTHRLILGGEGSIRGYSRSQFGRYFIANNSLTMSMEYRFPVLYFPEMDLYFLNQFSSVFSAISYRIDGAFIIDYGRVADTPRNLFATATDRRESGAGFGGGLRFVTPTFERSVCVDVVWGTDPWSRRGYMTFLPKPMWHFYLDMFF